MTVITRLTVGGVGSHVVALDRELRRQGGDVVLVAGSGDVTERPLEPDVGTTVSYVRSMRRDPHVRDDVSSLRELVGLMRQFRPDVVHTNQSKAGALGRVAAKVAGVPAIVHTYHGIVFEKHFGSLGSRAVRMGEAVLVGLSDGLVAVSRATASSVANAGIAPVSRIEVIGPALDLRLAAPRERMSDLPVIGWIGRFAEVKRLDRFLEAAALVALQSPVTLVIGGDGTGRQRYEQRARDLGIGDRTKFVGWIDDVSGFMDGLDVLVVSSDMEGMPVAILEANARGVPVVAAAVGGVPDALNDGASGILCQPTSEALADGILSVIRTPGIFAGLSNSGLRSVTQFGAAICAERHLRLYETLLQRKRGEPPPEDPEPIL